jgi:hypothetical protein
MTLDEIMYTLEIGGKVYWHNDNYEVIKDSIGQYLIHSKFNDYYIGLTHSDKKTMNGKEEDFYEVKA